MTSSHTRIRRLLIANRGEIARRIIRTCRVLDIETVAVYSDVDAHAPHVREATFSEPIGGPMAYLSIDAIAAAAKRSGADSVHPGYGFLSENPALPEALSKEGILFIGPNAETIRTLGSNTNAKAIAAKANVPVAPTLLLSGDSIDQHVQNLHDFTVQVGFPVIIKAAAGGGGRGMRIVTCLEEAKQALESAARESQKAFGSAEIFVEKFIAPARHIEVQIAGDAHGNVIALGTRDCSLQRSNQKIIEEAPALELKAGVSVEICEAARRLTKEVGYSNLGTVEFLYTNDGLFYFLEVNTRLQVEHPVTELVTGLDLVKLQIQIAQGETLRNALGTDETPKPFGHAIEARLCAEEFTGQFVTATGVVLDAHIPRGPVGSGLVRADMGYDVCSEVSHHYDSLLGKIIVHAPDRQQAVSLLRDALSQTRISGIGTNRSLLLHLLATDTFRNLQHSVQGTATLLPSADQLHDDWITCHAITAAIRLRTSFSNWAGGSPWSEVGAALDYSITYPFSTSIHGVDISSESAEKNGGVFVHITNPIEREVFIRANLDTSHATHTESYSVSIDRAAPIQVVVLRDGPTAWVHTPSNSVGLTVTHYRPQSQTAGEVSAQLSIRSPIPGKVVTIQVAAGDRVKQGDLLVVLDSMKMEHPFRAPRDGVVASVGVSTGTVVTSGMVLAVLAA